MPFRSPNVLTGIEPGSDSKSGGWDGFAERLCCVGARPTPNVLIARDADPRSSGRPMSDGVPSPTTHLKRTLRIVGSGGGYEEERRLVA